jgi:hypothetical protein
MPDSGNRHAEIAPVLLSGKEGARRHPQTPALR